MGRIKKKYKLGGISEVLCLISMDSCLVMHYKIHVLVKIFIILFRIQDNKHNKVSIIKLDASISKMLTTL